MDCHTAISSPPRNPTQFRIFSPDELSSNKLDGVLEVTTRNFQWKEETANKGGRVLEMLSEHTCQGWMQGYSLTGRYALLPSYETFLGIITTMMIQYAKVRKRVGWTLTWSFSNWRDKQAGEGRLHPSTILKLQLCGDKNTMVTLTKTLCSSTTCWTWSQSSFASISHLTQILSFVSWTSAWPLLKGIICAFTQLICRINLVVSTKAPSPLWLTIEEAVEHCREGVGIWKWLSTDEGRDPDLVVAGCGNETNVEVCACYFGSWLV